MTPQQNIFTDFAERPDLIAIGFTFVRSEHRAKMPPDNGVPATETVWASPDDPKALLEYRRQEREGKEPGAALFIYEGSLTLLIRPEWREVRWFTEYVEGLAREIHHEGPKNFFAAMVPVGNAMSVSAS